MRAGRQRPTPTDTGKATSFDVPEKSHVEVGAYPLTAGIATSDPHAEVSDHYVASSAQFAVQPIVGDYFGTPKHWEGEEPSSTELTARIASEHRKLMKIYVAAADEPKRVARAKALDLGIRLAVEQEVLSKHLSVPLRDMVVSSGSVYFPAADLSTKIDAATRLAVGRKLGDCLTRSYVSRPSPDALAAELTGVVSSAMGPLRERYLSTVRARNDRKTVRERVAVMDAAVAHMIRKWAKHAAKFHEVSLSAILPGEVTVNGGIVAIAAGGAQADGETPESSSTAPELAAA